jgi:hypothetical protein
LAGQRVVLRAQLKADLSAGLRVPQREYKTVEQADQWAVQKVGQMAHQKATERVARMAHQMVLQSVDVSVAVLVDPSVDLRGDHVMVERWAHQTDGSTVHFFLKDC